MNNLFPEDSYMGKCSCGKEFIAPKGVIHCHNCLYQKISELENTRTQSQCDFNDLREIAYNMKVVGCQMSNVMFNLKQTGHEKSELFNELQELWDSVNKQLPPKVGE